MGDTTKIDWEDLRKGYNRIYSTDFSSPQAMVADIYDHELTLRKVADILGLAKETVGKYMQLHDLPRLKKGHRGSSLFYLLYKKIENSEKYTSKELADMVGCSVSYIYNLRQKRKKHG